MHPAIMGGRTMASGGGIDAPGVHERYRRQTDRQTDDRQTDGRQHIANMNMSSRSLKTTTNVFLVCKFSVHTV